MEFILELTTATFSATATTNATITVTTGNPSNLPEMLTLTIGSTIVWSQNIDGENNHTNVVVSGVVPPASCYFVTTDGNNTTISRWAELS